MQRLANSRSLHYKTRLLGIALLIPAILFIAYTMVIPVGWNLVLSFAEWDGFSSMKMIGLDNYTELFQDSTTINGFKYSVIIALLSTFICLMLGFVLALLVYKTGGNKEGSVFRLIFFAPNMMPFIVIGLLFSFLLSPDMGLFNQIFRALGWDSLDRAWLGEPGIVLITVSVVSGWKGAGGAMMLFYTSMVSIPASMFEAARLEGANFIQQIRMIILPLIMPTIQLVSMLVLIGSFKSYDIIATMTKGGPGDYSKTVPKQMLDVAFFYNEFGYAAAIGVIFTILVAIIMFVMRKIARGDVYEY